MTISVVGLATLCANSSMFFRVEMRLMLVYYFSASIIAAAIGRDA